jgi:hypothetical protein
MLFGLSVFWAVIRKTPKNNWEIYRNISTRAIVFLAGFLKNQNFRPRQKNGQL